MTATPGSSEQPYKYDVEYMVALIMLGGQRASSAIELLALDRSKHNPDNG